MMLSSAFTLWASALFKGSNVPAKKYHGDVFSSGIVLYKLIPRNGLARHGDVGQRRSGFIAFIFSNGRFPIADYLKHIVFQAKVIDAESFWMLTLSSARRIFSASVFSMGQDL